MIESWRQHFNGVRPHSSLGYWTPSAFAAQLATEASGEPMGLAASISVGLGVPAHCFTAQAGQNTQEAGLSS